MLASSLNGYNGQGNDSGQNALLTGGMQNAEELLDSQGAHGLGEMPNIGVGYYKLSEGDKVEILYSKNIGRDLE